MLFAGAIMVGAALLFILEPMYARMVLPRLGGTPAVWNTCLVFYQAMLLAGYAYAHVSVHWLGARRQAVLHLIVLGLPWIVLPIGVSQGWMPQAWNDPIPDLLILLTTSVALPFLVVSAASPMLQVWFSWTGDPSARDPYFLYAASNLGSLIGLLSYPLVIESHLTLPQQSWAWTAGYGVLMAMTAGSAVALWRSPKSAAEMQTDARRGAAKPQAARDATPRRILGRMLSPRQAQLLRRLRWLTLALVPSSLLLGVTTYISTDIVAMPMVWVIPLALYLLSFVLVFARRQILPHRWLVGVQAPLVLVVAATFYLVSMGMIPSAQTLLLFTVHLALFFVTAMVCHGELAADRPSREGVTEFYLWISLGGVLGGIFNGLVAPVIFTTVLEYPLMIAAACLLRPRISARPDRAQVSTLLPRGATLLLFAGLAWAIVRFETDRRYIWIPAAGAAALLAFLLRRRPLRFGPAVGALLVVSRLCSATHVPVLYASRSFFGILRVESIPWLASNKLLHGSTVHGMQSRDPDRRREPLTYFHRTGPLGKVFAAISERPEFTAGGRIGIIGLGTGAVSAYGTPGQHVTYYEIDPAVERIARDPRLFTYVSDSLAQTDVILGDARLSLEHGPSRQFDLLIVDAFSSDYIPVHLLTTEAIHLYQSHLADRGLLALHISNRYLDLKPVVRKLAEQAHAVARFCADTLVENYPGKYASTWVVVAAREEDLGKLYRDPAWQPLPSERDQRLWTDDFSNVLGAMRWEFGSQPVEPARRRGAADANAFMKAFRLYGQGHIPEAVAEFRGIVERNPDDTSARRYLGEILLEQGQADEAIVHFRKAAEVAPLSAQSQLDLGGALARQQRDTEAISHLRKALELDPRSAEAHRQIANVLIRQNEADQAIEHYRKALEINPRDAKTHTNLGLALWTHKGRVNDAIAHFREALAIDPRYEAARKNLDLAEKENPRNRNEDAR